MSKAKGAAWLGAAVAGVLLAAGPAGARAEGRPAPSAAVAPPEGKRPLTAAQQRNADRAAAALRAAERRASAKGHTGSQHQVTPAPTTAPAEKGEK